MKNRTIAYYRHHRKRVIRRKCNILKQLWGREAFEGYFSKDGKSGAAFGTLSKGKVHCSCPMCRTKSYDELSHRDKKRLENMRQQIKEYEHTK